jgi:ATP-binding cassette subfamily F protein 3
MRTLSGEEAPDDGSRTEGHQVVMQYFRQDEATRLDAALTVYETLSADSPNTMVPAIRNILGGFLFSGDDVYKKAGVLSGGERTRLAVARMLLQPSNTLLLDEPTNHLDIDSKEVLLDALADYGGTLIFVSHDRYFVERLATKIIEIGSGTAIVFPGTYKEFLYHKEHAGDTTRQEGARSGKQEGTKAERQDGKAGRQEGKAVVPRPSQHSHDRDDQKPAATPKQSHDDKKRVDAEARKRQRAVQARQARIDTLEARIAETEAAIRDVEQQMSAPGFYDNRAAAQPVVDRHQALMWQVGDLMHQWEELQTLNDPTAEPLTES